MTVICSVLQFITVYYEVLRVVKKVFSKNIIPIHANTVGTAQTINSSTKVFFSQDHLLDHLVNCRCFHQVVSKLKFFEILNFWV